MIVEGGVEVAPSRPTVETSRARIRERRWNWLFSSIFAREAVTEAVTTRVHFNASPEAIWNRILFYEEVRAHPPLLLRLFLPQPTRTEGDKTRVGATVRCVYAAGNLVKRITAVQPPTSLRFDVIEQKLGIEACVLTLSGSYEIHTSDGATCVELTTRYRAYLHPRVLWRPVEALLVRQLHRHILRGLRANEFCGESILRPAVSNRLALPPNCAHPGDLTCTTSESHSHR